MDFPNNTKMSSSSTLLINVYKAWYNESPFSYTDGATHSYFGDIVSFSPDCHIKQISQ